MEGVLFLVWTWEQQRITLFPETDRRHWPDGSASNRADPNRWHGYRRRLRVLQWDPVFDHQLGLPQQGQSGVEHTLRFVGGELKGDLPSAVGIRPCLVFREQGIGRVEQHAFQ